MAGSRSVRVLSALVAVPALLALGVTACGDTAGASPGGGRAQTAQAEVDVLSILPPGNATGPSQRAMYDALTRVVPSQIRDADLAKYYKPAPLDPAPADVVTRSSPRPGVTIVRDRYGVPYVYGTTDEDTAYGAGYAGTQDRMFVMDALRFAGAGRRSELLGASADNLAADAAQLRQADYPPAEANAQVAAIGKEGPAGAALVARLRAFVAGVNAARKAMCPTVTAATCPVPYRLLKLTPKPYTDGDIVYAASLVGGIYGKGGGREAANAVFLRQLQKKLGDVEGRRVLTDLADPTDPEAPVTVPDPAPYGAPGPIDPTALALPDLGGKVAPGTGGLPPELDTTSSGGSGAGAGGGAGAGAGGGGDRVGLHVDVPGETSPDATAHMSNAVLIAGGHSATGHPIAVFGPQTGYQAPNFWDEIALHGPHYSARGVAFVNLQFAVLVGHGRSYAWSATSSNGDVVDTVLERLCDTNGRPATVTSTAYMDGDRCVPMPTHQHVEHGSGGKVIATFTSYRSAHGIVQYRTTAGGRPVAVVSQRSTYGREAQSVLGFAQMNDPAAIRGPADFLDAFSKVEFTFNWFYVDTRDIATFTSGRLPLRAPGTDPALPRWGDARWDWQGFLPADGHPHAVNPPAGYIVNWNNKPSSGTYAADEEWGWGPVHRMLALRDRIQAALVNGTLTRAGVVGIVTDAATVDTRGAYLLSDLLNMVGMDDPATRPYVALLRRWQESGAHRADPGRTGRYADSAAIALLDAWYPEAAKTVLSGRLGPALAGALPNSPDNTPVSHGGSSFNDVASYSYVDKDLRTIQGLPVKGKLSQVYCGGGVPAACRAALRASLTTAVRTVSDQQKTRDPARWTYPTSKDEIQFTYVGDTVAPITWQNRSTFQQVVNTPR